MVPVDQKQFQDSLLEKRDNLSEWLYKTPERMRQVCLGTADETVVQSQLDNLDTAVEKATEGILGICTVCSDFIETRLLEMDYTTSVCLDHLSIEEKRSLEMELELAQTVQRSLLPQQVPETSLLETAAFSRPAQIVGGDYFDFFRFQDGTHGIALGDVAGHGVSASLHMASIQALLRTLIPTSTTPHEVVGHVNRLLIHNLRFTNFVALFLAAFDPETYTLTYCNAGHTPPLLLTKGRVMWLSPTGAAIGLVEDMPYRLETLELQPGDVLLLCTDGVTEAENTAGEQFGAERLAAAAQGLRFSSARDLVQGMRQTLEAYTAGQPLVDDVTIVACKVLG
jgi:sigma-B regulation protein RsbU (phosphoserine phosphatase)